MELLTTQFFHPSINLRLFNPNISLSTKLNLFLYKTVQGSTGIALLKMHCHRKRTQRQKHRKWFMASAVGSLICKDTGQMEPQTEQRL
jgi:hypothetical protein